MTKTIKARYHEGKLEPLEPLELADGEEVTITLASPASSPTGLDPLTATSGAWKDLLDCEQFEQDVLHSGRSATAGTGPGRSADQGTDR